MTHFDAAFDTLIGSEGGYVNNPKDPGGETKYGISKRSYPNIDIKALTLNEAKGIYKRDFWDRVRGDELPYTLAFNLFDAAVNSGIRQAVKWLQISVGALPDGAFGPLTMNAVRSLPTAVTAARLNGNRLADMTDFTGWKTFNRGWARRIGKNLIGITEV